MANDNSNNNNSLPTTFTNVVANNLPQDILYQVFLRSLRQCWEYDDPGEHLVQIIRSYRQQLPHTVLPYHLYFCLYHHGVPTRVQFYNWLLACGCRECKHFIQYCDFKDTKLSYSSSSRHAAENADNNDTGDDVTEHEI